MESIHLGTCKCGLYKEVVFIYDWSLEQVWLYIYFTNTLFAIIPPRLSLMASSFLSTALTTVAMVSRIDAGSTGSRWLAWLGADRLRLGRTRALSFCGPNTSCWSCNVSSVSLPDSRWRVKPGGSTVNAQLGLLSLRIKETLLSRLCIVLDLDEQNHDYQENQIQVILKYLHSSSRCEMKRYFRHFFCRSTGWLNRVN